MPQLSRVRAIVAPDAYNFRRAHRRQKRGLFECDRLDLACAQTLHVAVSFFGRGEQNSHNRFAAGYGFHQSIAGLTIQLKAAIFHRYLSKHGGAGLGENSCCGCKASVENLLGYATLPLMAERVRTRKKATAKRSTRKSPRKKSGDRGQAAPEKNFLSDKV